MATRQQKRDRMDVAGLLISAASLGVGIAALCLNEKGERMPNKIDSSKYSTRKDLKRAYAKEIKRAAVSDIGYTGTVIVLNERGEPVQYGLVPLENRKAVSERRPPARKSNKTQTSKSWVAMEINSATGKDRQAIVCSSREQAKAKATAMKKAHRSGSKQSRECVQGYALMDTSDTIDVAAMFSGKGGQMYRV
ncbi:hypothetical protein AOA81_04670 [Methanomassiliicoccales archaeon RumEn M2]|nr:hypothetical protein AOA81_04670 [Methanomassiliicoccales archaeon RumEn M2]